MSDQVGNLICCFSHVKAHYFLFLKFQIPIVLYKDEDKDERGNMLVGPDGKPRYRCGFRIGGGIDQDNTKSPQGYPDKVI